MKKLNVAHWERALLRTVQQKITEVNPFPGKWPTKIAYALRVKGRRHPVTYAGKPSTTAVARFRKFSRIKGTTGWFVEFDARNPICWLSQIHRYWTQNNPVYGRYHYWDADSVHAFTAKFYRKRVAGFTLYSPFEKLKRQQIEDYKAWLRVQGVKVEQGAASPPKTAKDPNRHWYFDCRYCGRVRLLVQNEKPLRCHVCGSDKIHLSL